MDKVGEGRVCHVEQSSTVDAIHDVAGEEPSDVRFLVGDQEGAAPLPGVGAGPMWRRTAGSSSWSRRPWRANTLKHPAVS